MSLKCIIQVNDMNKTFNEGKRNEVKALINVNLAIKKGEFISIMGPSGSGKTTLLNLIGALDKPTSGSIWIDNHEINKIPEYKLHSIRRQSIGFIFQRYYLVPTLNVLENVLTPLLIVKANWKHQRERAKELLKMVGLKKRITHKPKELSGGERQRVAIARALINNPEIILADEPTGNLDSVTGQKIIQLLKDINTEKGITTIIVTHDPVIGKQTERSLSLMDGILIKQKK